MDLQWWIVGIGVPVMGGLISWIWRVQGLIDAKVTPVVDRINGVEREGFQWRESVSRIYATAASVEMLEHRLTAALERMDAKLDRLIERKTGGQ